MSSRDPASSEESRISATFVKYMVPFYARCLIDVRIWFFLVAICSSHVFLFF